LEAKRKRKIKKIAQNNSDLKEKMRKLNHDTFEMKNKVTLLVKKVSLYCISKLLNIILEKQAKKGRP
jgi:predicted nuclease with TOPRIM domain